ncbi:MAG: 30S ribosomal protein S9 [Candidatus Gracilibacteria bacterium]
MDAPVKKVAAAKEAKVKKVIGTYYYADGQRKTSEASVRLIEKGTGIITVNERTFENYFPVFTDQDKILSPLRVTNQLKTFDITVKVQGGGIHSQAEAIRHGISKALLAYNVEYRSLLKPIGFLTRDSRVKERKKYGLKRARRAPQWQKR